MKYLIKLYEKDNVYIYIYLTAHMRCYVLQFRKKFIKIFNFFYKTSLLSTTRSEYKI